MGKEASGEELMVIGFLMCAYGMWVKLYWFELAGFMLFFIGVLSLKQEKKEEEGGHQEEGEDLKPLGPTT